MGLSLLRAGKPFKVLVLEEGVDPGDLGPNGLAGEMVKRREVEDIKGFLDILSSIHYQA